MDHPKDQPIICLVEFRAYWLGFLVLPIFNLSSEVQPSPIRGEVATEKTLKSLQPAVQIVPGIPQETTESNPFKIVCVLPSNNSLPSSKHESSSIHGSFTFSF